MSVHELNDIADNEKYATPKMLKGVMGFCCCTPSYDTTFLDPAALDERITLDARIKIAEIHAACMQQAKETKRIPRWDISVDGEHVYWLSMLGGNDEPRCLQFVQFRLEGKTHKYCLVWTIGKKDKPSTLLQVGSFE